MQFEVNVDIHKATRFHFDKIFLIGCSILKDSYCKNFNPVFFIYIHIVAFFSKQAVSFFY